MRSSLLCSLVVCLMHTAWCAADPPRPYAPLPVFRDMEAYDRAYLDSCRRLQASVRDTIAWSEKRWAEDLEDLQDFLPQDKVLSFHQTLAELRQELKKWDRMVRELEDYEKQRKLNPGSATDDEALKRRVALRAELWPPTALAPPPREKK